MMGCGFFVMLLFLCALPVLLLVGCAALIGLIV